MPKVKRMVKPSGDSGFSTARQIRQIKGAAEGAVALFRQGQCDSVPVKVNTSIVISIIFNFLNLLLWVLEYFFLGLTPR